MLEIKESSNLDKNRIICINVHNKKKQEEGE